ncbi:MAG: hypothetical protein HOV81_40040 [Kofleriaceae bacterium]|nr:hypothetical protein [Kofleriaceae bacterium]
MSDRARVVLIFVVVGLIAGGAGFYFFKIYRPAQDLKNAQEEIAGWETRFAAARDCLLGKSPGSAKTSEALAIREMAPDPWDRGKCTPLVSKLSRGEAPDTGIPDIEKAWAALDKASQKAAMAFADHVARSTTLEKDPLPQALDDLDAARANLRKSAKLPATTQTGKALPTAQIIPLRDGKDPVTSLEIDAIPSETGMVLFGKTANRLVQVSTMTGGTPKIDRIGPTSLRSVPDTSWGATPEQGEVDVGAFDAEGVIATPTSLKVSDRSIVAAVVGSLADGVVVYGIATELYVAHAKNGTITAEPGIKIASAIASTDTDGRAVVMYTTPDKKYFARILHRGGDEPALELPEAPLGQPCMTHDRAWAQTVDEVFAFGGGQPILRKPLGYAALQGCTRDAALFRDRTVAKALLICADDCRKVTIPSGAPDNAATTVVGGKLVAIAAHGGVLGVWREGEQPIFYSLPEDAHPVLAQEWTAMAMTDGKVIDVVARGVETFVIIRIPAT